jgi:hypothetical protein
MITIDNLKYLRQQAELTLYFNFNLLSYKISIILYSTNG